jgi:hypothetical protein
MKIESKTLGKIRWINGTLPRTTLDSVIKYDEKENEILFKFPSYESLIDANGTHEITITLLDSKSESMEYEMSVMFVEPKGNFTPNETNSDEMKLTGVNYKSNLHGKIKSLNRYGELRIEFSEAMNTTLGFENLNSEVSSLNESLR